MVEEVVLLPEVEFFGEGGHQGGAHGRIKVFLAESVYLRSLGEPLFIKPAPFRPRALLKRPEVERPQVLDPGEPPFAIVVVDLGHADAALIEDSRGRKKTCVVGPRVGVSDEDNVDWTPVLQHPKIPPIGSALQNRNDFHVRTGEFGKSFPGQRDQFREGEVWHSACEVRTRANARE